MMYDLGIKEITPADAEAIISTRQPLGLFYLMENGVYVGIDNNTGDAWVEEFPDLKQCKEWLLEYS